MTRPPAPPRDPVANLRAHLHILIAHREDHPYGSELRHHHEVALRRTTLALDKAIIRGATTGPM